MATTPAGCSTLFPPAVDEQNAQTQAQEGFVLGLPTTEEKRDPRKEDKACPPLAHSEGCGVPKGRGHRKGTAVELGFTSGTHRNSCVTESFRELSYCFGPGPCQACGLGACITEVAVGLGLWGVLSQKT